MYQFKPVSPRVESFHRRVRDRVFIPDAEKTMIITEVWQKNETVIPIIKRCLAMKELCERMTLRVEDDSLFVGNLGKNFCGSCPHPVWYGAGWVHEIVGGGQWGEVHEDGFYHSPDTEMLKFKVAPEDVEQLSSVADYWKTHMVTSYANAWTPEGYDDFCELEVSKNVKGAPLMMMTAGHLTPGYNRLMKLGFGKIRGIARKWLDEHKCDLMGDNIRKSMFYQGVVYMCDAFTTLAKRYAGACNEKAEACADENRAKELRMMSKGLENISENTPDSYWEACQLMLLYQLFLQLENQYPAVSFGRFDQLTWPFLKKDLDLGRLTMEQAQEITDFFFLHSNSFYRGLPGKGLAETTGIGNTYQHTTLGGVDPDTGEDATNPVTYMALESVGRMGLHDPTISLRINKNTPEELWFCAFETNKRVGGLPLFQNDEVVIPAVMSELGFSLHDARDYCFIGCQEITGHGNDYSAANGISPPNASLHYAPLLDMAINNGVNPWNGKQCPVQCGHLYEMNSIEEVREAFKKTIEYATKAQVTFDNYTEMLAGFYGTTVGLSLSMEGCLESGLDCTWGGAKYNSYGGTATGLATVADSLTTIKYMCFDKKLCTTRELYDAVMANWEGYEVLRQTIINKVPHFGNADPYADEEMKWCCDTYYNACKQCCSERSKVYKAGLYGASDHVRQGRTSPATPDGRKNGEPVADASSPAQGRDRTGPTAVMLSECAFDHSKFMDGLALNIRLHPDVLEDEEGMSKLESMIKVYFEKKGMEVQFNIVNTETLKKAQANPEEYRDLVVRIAGYSAYFIELSVELQNDIIARSENLI